MAVCDHPLKYSSATCPLRRRISAFFVPFRAKIAPVPSCSAARREQEKHQCAWDRRAPKRSFGRRAPSSRRTIKTPRPAPSTVLSEAPSPTFNLSRNPLSPQPRRRVLLLQQAMAVRGVQAVARVVLSKREQFVLVRPFEELLCMTILKYASQIRGPSLFRSELAEAEIGPQERTLAETLVDERTSAEFDLDRYPDEYTQKLTQLVWRRSPGRTRTSALCVNRRLGNPGRETPSTRAKNTLPILAPLAVSVRRSM